MKRLLLILALLVMFVGVQGYAVDFQNPEDFALHVGCYQTDPGHPGDCAYAQNTSGGNSYWFISGYSSFYSGNGGIGLTDNYQTTYSAATYVGGSGTSPRVVVRYYDSVGTDMGGACADYLSPGDRITSTIIGGHGHLYVNDIDSSDYSGCIGAYMNVVPSKTIWYAYPQGSYQSANIYLDDIIWGSTESKYIFGMPQHGYFLQKDILNPDTNGFYRVNQTDPNGTATPITSYTFTSTFGKNSGTNETVVLSSTTGGSGLTYSTGTAYAGTINWNLTQFFSQSTTGYGLYRTDINPQLNSPGFATSEWILYIGSGASIRFDKNSYAIGETAILTVVVSDSYYNTATYSYHVVIQDIYGTEVYDAPISFSASPHTGTANYQWATTDNEGVYYGLIYAKRLSDNVELLMNYDTADLNSNLVVNGYVFDAETAAVISGATVNVTQGTTTDSLTSAADGNYSSTSAFSANQPTTIVASKTGYETYQHVFTPLYAGSIQINLTLMPTSPTYTGIALGGIARTPPYNRTINSATVYILNTTDGHSYTATTNAAGYYIQNNMAGASHWFDVWGTKTGFSNSSIYQKLVVGI